jgi:hypothetical protein
MVGVLKKWVFNARIARPATLLPQNNKVIRMSYLLLQKTMAILYSPETLPGNKNALKMLIITACIVAVIDGLAALCIAFFLYGRSPVSVFQYIASGLLGPSAFSGGLNTAFLGLICHFFISSMWTVFFFVVHRTISRLLPHWALKGVIYGIAIWLGMNLMVLPLSHVSGGTPGVRQILIGAATLICAVGLPMAYRFDQYYFKK